MFYTNFAYIVTSSTILFSLDFLYIFVLTTFFQGSTILIKEIYHNLEGDNIYAEINGKRRKEKRKINRTC